MPLLSLEISITIVRMDSYERTAEYYDQIYAWKPYADEARRLVDLLARHGVAQGARVLEAACGTGAYLAHLSRLYEVSGFDVSQPMLTRAAAKLVGVPLFRADMTNFSVSAPVDAIVCLFSSIGYLLDEASLRSAARSMANALVDGGILILEPWVAPEDFVTGRPTMHTFDGPDLKLCRSIVSRREDDLSVLRFHWLVARAQEKDVEHWVEEHRLWLCPFDLLSRIFHEAGFAVESSDVSLTPGRRLLLGTKVRAAPVADAAGGG